MDSCLSPYRGLDRRKLQKNKTSSSHAVTQLRLRVALAVELKEVGQAEAGIETAESCKIGFSRVSTQSDLSQSEKDRLGP